MSLTGAGGSGAWTGAGSGCGAGAGSAAFAGFADGRAGADAGSGAAGGSAGYAARSLRTTGASIVDDGERTNSPSSFNFAIRALLSTPSSLASS